MIVTPALRRIMVELARDGASNREIAERLFLSETTVHTYVADLMYIAEVHNRTALVLWWIRIGQYLHAEKPEAPKRRSRGWRWIPRIARERT